MHSGGRHCVDFWQQKPTGITSDGVAAPSAPCAAAVDDDEPETYYCLLCHTPCSATSLLVGTHTNHPRRTLNDAYQSAPTDLQRDVAELRSCVAYFQSGVSRSQMTRSQRHDQLASDLRHAEVAVATAIKRRDALQRDLELLAEDSIEETLADAKRLRELRLAGSQLSRAAAQWQQVHDEALLTATRGGGMDKDDKAHRHVSPSAAFRGDAPHAHGEPHEIQRDDDSWTEDLQQVSRDVAAVLQALEAVSAQLQGRDDEGSHKGPVATGTRRSATDTEALLRRARHGRADELNLPPAKAPTAKAKASTRRYDVDSVVAAAATSSRRPHHMDHLVHSSENVRPTPMVATTAQINQTADTDGSTTFLTASTALCDRRASSSRSSCSSPSSIDSADEEASDDVMRPHRGSGATGAKVDVKRGQYRSSRCKGCDAATSSSGLKREFDQLNQLILGRNH